eukprot:15124202-Alexandrium_andersonii.AAC.1
MPCRGPPLWRIAFQLAQHAGEGPPGSQPPPPPPPPAGGRHPARARGEFPDYDNRTKARRRDAALTGYR